MLRDLLLRVNVLLFHSLGLIKCGQHLRFEISHHVKGLRELIKIDSNVFHEKVLDILQLILKQLVAILYLVLQ